MSRARFITVVACVVSVVLAAASAPAGALLRPHDAGVPAVTLTSPASGALITGGQPFFGGSAGTDPSDANTVSIQVFTGSSASGVPVQVLGATVSSGGSYSTGPSSPLPDGLYTAQASQGSSAGAGTSPAVTFRIFNAAPGIQLNAPASEPQTTGTPTLSGTASTGPGASSTVSLTVYPGPSTNATPAGSTSGAVGPHGAFSVTISSALSDGQYTIVATQSLGGGSPTFSAPVTIEVKSQPPAMTLTSPIGGSSMAQGAVSFAGAAGDGYGDLPEVDLTLYRGSAIGGQVYGTEAVTPSGATWQAGWPSLLPLGIYTLQAQQHDIAGRATTATVTFIVIPAPSIIGQSVQISQSGVVTVPIGCLADSGSCGGVVLIITRREFQTRPGGPRGHLRVLFAGFAVPAGTERVISRRLPATSFRALRGRGRQPVNIIVVTSANGGPKQIVTGLRNAKVGS